MSLLWVFIFHFCDFTGLLQIFLLLSGAFILKHTNKNMFMAQSVQISESSYSNLVLQVD